jgi:hypothetical protein
MKVILQECQKRVEYNGNIGFFVGRGISGQKRVEKHFTYLNRMRCGENRKSECKCRDVYLGLHNNIRSYVHTHFLT